MPLLMSRKQSPEAESSASFRSRSSAPSHRTGFSQRASELRARYEMAQAIQKPWPLHLLENGVKPTSGSASSRSTRSSTLTKHTSPSASRSSSRRESRNDAAPASAAATHTELTELDSRTNKKNRNSSNSLEKLSLSPTMVSNWIRRASKDSDKSGRSSSPPSSSNTSPSNSPKDL